MKRLTPFDNYEEKDDKFKEAAYILALNNFKQATGMTHDMADSFARLLFREIADSLAINGVVKIPTLGVMYFARPKARDAIKLKLKPSKELKTIYKNRGTDENKVIRAIEKSTIGDFTGNNEGGESVK